VNGDVVSNAFCSRMADASNIRLSLNESVCAVDFS